MPDFTVHPNGGGRVASGAVVVEWFHAGGCPRYRIAGTPETVTILAPEVANA